MDAYKAAVDEYDFRAFVSEERAEAGLTEPPPRFIRATPPSGARTTA